MQVQLQVKAPIPPPHHVKDIGVVIPVPLHRVQKEMVRVRSCRTIWRQHYYEKYDYNETMRTGELH